MVSGEVVPVEVTGLLELNQDDHPVWSDCEHSCKIWVPSWSTGKAGRVLEGRFIPVIVRMTKIIVAPRSCFDLVPTDGMAIINVVPLLSEPCKCKDQQTYIGPSRVSTAGPNAVDDLFVEHPKDDCDSQSVQNNRTISNLGS